MQITLVDSGKILGASDLISATLRTDLVPVPVSLEFSVQLTPEIENELVDGKEIIVQDISHPLTLINVEPLKTQLIKNDKRVGAIACIAVLSACKNLIIPSAKAIIREQSSFNSILRSIGVKDIELGSDLPLPEFICLKGQLPSVRLAKYLQQEAAVICYRDSKISAVKIDSLFKHEPKMDIDPGQVHWINSAQLQHHNKSSFVSVESDGSTVISADSVTPGQQVNQVSGLDSRQLKNMEKVLIKKGEAIRSSNIPAFAGDIVRSNGINYVLVTTAIQTDTGVQGNSSGSLSKYWLASL
ncbi:hypothetical protein [Acinetobacter chinensis]|uniref:hypothetical protein n=1 Tax=Acinetobacter chinensis TaxID=2004650 RepID=UPI002934C251|nr:hypothetical protein [Acinetobacter chinensis]WOE40053.1 hypothetical protein QSG87_09015 [Acinetobacter chinensis]